MANGVASRTLTNAVALRLKIGERIDHMLFVKVSPYCGHEAPGLRYKRRDLVVRQFDIFPIVAALSQLKGLIQRASERFRKKSAFNEVFVKTPVCFEDAWFIDEKGQYSVEHGIVQLLMMEHLTRQKKLRLCEALRGLLEAILYQRLSFFINGQTTIPSLSITR